VPSGRCVTRTQDAYKDFLRSSAWKTIRDQRVMHDTCQCQHCGTGGKLDVHHLNYDRPWGHERMEDLLTLCRRCHYQEHERANVSSELVLSDDNLNFNFAGHSVRIVMIEGEPWWVAMDVCTALGIGNPRDAMNRLDEDDVGSTDTIDDLGRSRTVNIVSDLLSADWYLP
jgi:BRO family, N-terminal domain